jgi:hypothetical protein
VTLRPTKAGFALQERHSENVAPAIGLDLGGIKVGIVIESGRFAIRVFIVTQTSVFADFRDI